MDRLRSLISGVLRIKPVLSRIGAPAKMQIARHHDHGPPMPFDNMPFNKPNRYCATLFFGVFFGIGFWAPFIIVWYSMAKKTL